MKAENKYLTRVYNAKSVCELVDALWLAILSEPDRKKLDPVFCAYFARMNDFKPFYGENLKPDSKKGATL